MSLKYPGNVSYIIHVILDPHFAIDKPETRLNSTFSYLVKFSLLKLVTSLVLSNESVTLVLRLKMHFLGFSSPDTCRVVNCKLSNVGILKTVWSQV